MQCQSSLQRPGRPRRWTRWGSRRLKTTARAGLKWQPRLQTRRWNYKTSSKSSRMTSSKRTPVLTIFRKGMMSWAPFLRMPKTTLLWSSELPNNLLTFWIQTMLLALKILVWTLRKTSLKLTLAPSSSILVLQAFSFKRVLKMSTSRTMPLPSLLRTIPLLEITLSERRLKYYFIIFLFFFFFIIFFYMRSIVLDHLNLSKYILLVYNLCDELPNNCLLGFTL